MVCDYRTLNKIIIPESNPLPLVNGALDQLSGATIFRRQTLRTFTIRCEYVKRTVQKQPFTPCLDLSTEESFFGLTNALLTPQEYSRIFCIIFLSLSWTIFLPAVEKIGEDKAHLRQLFHIFDGNNLYAKRSECKIGVKEVEFFGHRSSVKAVYICERSSQRLYSNDLFVSPSGTFSALLVQLATIAFL